MTRALALAAAGWLLLTAAAASAQVTRTPYLQNGSSTAISVRWKTSTATNSRVSFGTTLGALGQTADNPAVSTGHEVRVTGLLPDTRYFYAVGSTSAIQAGNDANHFFVTAPAPGTPKPTRVWVLGDPGTGDSDQIAVRDAYYVFTGSRHTDLWLMLGDNAYDSGTDSEMQAHLYNVYPQMLRKSVLFPTRGNHETATSGGVPWHFINHTMPTAGEAGGLASGTEAYYAFDYGNIHFICLDSFGSSRSASGAMATWLRNDLLANTQTWTVAYWHHPPYSKGSHDSDSEDELIEMRENILPILEEGGVDLVLSGHSHTYERSYLLDGHYGSSGSFDPASHVVQPGDGREPGDGAYVKPERAPAPHAGAVYVVSGSAGQTEGGDLDHPAMFISLERLGSMVLDVAGNRLDAKFLRETGEVDDSFTLLKSGGNATPVPIHAQTASGSSASSATVRSGVVTAAANDLYLAAVSTRPRVAVQAVAGLGLTWTRVRTQCGGRGTTGVEVWQARGTPSGNGQVTATLEASAGRAVIAVSRYTGTSGPGASAAANTNGGDGACSGGSDRSSYAVPLATTAPGSLRYGAVALRNRTHRPGSGFRERIDFRRGSGSTAAGLAVQDRPAPAAGTAPVDGNLSGSTDWAVISLEIKP